MATWTGKRDEDGLPIYAMSDLEREARLLELRTRLYESGHQGVERLADMLGGKEWDGKVDYATWRASRRVHHDKWQAKQRALGPVASPPVPKPILSAEENRVANAAWVAKDRAKKREHRRKPEVRERGLELKRLARLRQGVPVRQAMPTEAAIPTPTLADGLTWPTMPARLPKFTRAHPGDEFHRPDDAATRRIRELLAASKVGK
jgi:hypothetical protein